MYNMPLSKTVRISVAAIMLSAAGLIGIATHEGYTSKAIIPVPGDKPTYGYGTTSGVKMGDTVTPDRALAYLQRDIGVAETALKRCIKVPIAQREWDVYVSFAYNVGTKAFCDSTLNKKLNAGDYVGACNELTKWVYVKGRVVKGLQNRRAEELRKCLGYS
jgi:lysozyme